MRLIPWWTLVSSGCAPVLLVGSWTIAELLQGPGYDPVTQTISVLGAYGAAGYWVITGSVITLGTCHLVTAYGLRAAAIAGRLALAGGGLCAMALALLPAPPSGGSLGHGWVVGIGFSLLAVWPILAARRAKTAPWTLRPVVSFTVTALIWLGAVWFLLELSIFHAPGIAERVLTFLQALWPLVVVTSCLGRRTADKDDPA